MRQVFFGGAPPAPAADEGDDADEVPLARVAPKPPVRRAKDDKPVDVVKLAKARLRQVEAELRRMRKLEAERDKLRRLVEAADTRKPAIVRDIKRSAG